MHGDFILNFPYEKVSCEYYRKEVSNMNISYTKLGEEECEECLFYNEHKHEANGECKMCEQRKKHNESARISRSQHYKMDSEKKSEGHTVYLSVDMQKVIVLTRISRMKTAVFTKRLIVFHETFAPLGVKVAENGLVKFGMKVLPGYQERKLLVRTLKYFTIQK